MAGLSEAAESLGLANGDADGYADAVVIVDAESFAVVCSGKFAVAVVMAAFGHLSVVAVVSLCNFDFRL